MTVTTQVVWSMTSPQETIDLLHARVTEHGADGKEVGTATMVKDYDNKQVTFIRTWIDEPTALEWLAFIQSYGPISAAVVN